MHALSVVDGGRASGDGLADAVVVTAARRRLGDSDLRWLADCRALQSLDISGNAVTSLTALGECRAALVRLYVSGNPLSRGVDGGLAPLSRFTALQDLDVSACGLSGLLTLPVTLTALRTLVCAGNDLTGVVGLAQLRQLDLLDASDNRVADVDGLSGVRDCTTLGKLALAGNPLTDCPRYRFAVYDWGPGGGGGVCGALEDVIAVRDGWISHPLRHTCRHVHHTCVAFYVAITARSMRVYCAAV